VLVARFRDRVLEVGGEVRSVDDWNGVVESIAEIVAARDATSVALSDHPELGRRLPQVLVGAEIVRAPTTAARLFGCEIGISTAQWGIADTGTLVLDGDAEAHRLVSLVPAVHIAVIEARRILPGITDALARIGPQGGAGPGHCVTFITGPSRTADIELTLVVGVHGPRELHIILIETA
jgi:L-lactate utilization protein LutC